MIVFQEGLLAEFNFDDTASLYNRYGDPPDYSTLVYNKENCIVLTLAHWFDEKEETNEKGLKLNTHIYFQMFTKY